MIDIPENVIIPEIKSEEQKIQADRERNTLAMLLFKPDAPSEPDLIIPETYSNLKTKLIPIEDVYIIFILYYLNICISFYF